MRTERAAAPDLETRERLLQVAATRFAERGVDEVTVREICAAAGANVAAVNYHFRDKAGLYREVVERAITLMQETTDLSQRGLDGATPEERLRTFIAVFVGRLAGSGQHAWIHRLMAREMEHPSAALTRVMSRVVEPRIAYLAGIVGAIMALPADDPRVLRSAASVQVQCLAFVRRVPAPMARAWGLDDLNGAVDHITTFSLGGMRALAAATLAASGPAVSPTSAAAART